MFFVAFFFPVLAILLVGFGVKGLLIRLVKDGDDDRTAGFSGAMPFITCCIFMLLLLLAAIVNLIDIAVYIIYFAAGISLLYSIYVVLKKRYKTLIDYWLTPGILAFCFAVAVIYLIYRAHPPFFKSWDDFSHWGLYYKNLFINGKLHLYTGIDIVHMAYPQGATVFYYLISWLLPTYTEPSIHFSLAVLYAAAAAVMFSRVSWKNRVTAGLSICALPFFFTLISSVNPYEIIYNDTLLGAFFGASLCLIVLFNDSGRAGTVMTGIALAAMVQIKESAIIFAGIVIVGVIIMRLLSPCGQTRLKRTVGHNISGRFIRRMVFIVAAVAVSLLIWKAALKFSLGETGSDFTKLNLTEFIKKLSDTFSGQDIYAGKVWDVFWEAICSWPIFVTGASTMALFIVFSALSVILAVMLIKKRKSIDYAMLFLLIPLCLVVYLASIYYTYIVSMSEHEALAAASFQRYSGTFFVGWIMLLTVGITYCWPQLKIGIWKQVIPVTLLALIIWLNGYAVLKLYTITSDQTLEDLGLSDKWIAAAEAKNIISENDKVWVIFPDVETLDDLMFAHVFQYYLYPIDADYRLGYANLLPAYAGDYQELNRETFLDIIDKWQITYLIISPVHGKVSGEYEEMFADKYEDNLEYAKDSGRTSVYKVCTDENGEYYFEVFAYLSA